MTLTTHRRWLALAAAALLSVVALTFAACGGDDDDDDGGSSADLDTLTAIQALDSTGLHEIEEQTLADGKAPGDAQNVARQSLTVLRLTDWPKDIEDEAKALEKHFEEMDAALDGTDAKKIAESVGKAHDAWHEFSHMVWEHLQKQAGIEAAHAEDHAAASPTAVPTPTKAVAKLDISGAKVRASTTDVTGAYLTIKNPGAEDRLLKASADPAVAGMVQVHEMVADGATMKMQEVKAGIVVPAGGELVLKPGGYHIMLMNLKQPLAVGQTVTLTLTFEKAGNMEVKAPVEMISSGMGN